MRNGIRLIWFGSALLCLSAVVLTRLYDTTSQHSLRQKPVADTENVEAVPSRPEAVSQFAPVQPTVAPPPTVSTVQSPPLPVEPPTEPPKTRAETVFEMQQKYDNDRQADRHAGEVRDAIDSSLKSALVEGSRVQSVECKLSTCRAVLSFPNIDADKASFRKVMDESDGPFAQYGLTANREKDADGSVTTTIFVNM